ESSAIVVKNASSIEESQAQHISSAASTPQQTPTFEGLPANQLATESIDEGAEEPASKDAKTESKDQSQAVIHTPTQNQTQPQAQSQSQPQTQAQAQSQSQTQTQPQAQSQPQTQNKTQTTQTLDAASALPSNALSDLPSDEASAKASNASSDLPSSLPSGASPVDIDDDLTDIFSDPTEDFTYSNQDFKSSTSPDSSTYPSAAPSTDPSTYPSADLSTDLSTALPTDLSSDLSATLSADPSAVPSATLEAQAQQDAYERSLKELLPTSPEQVKAYRRSLDARQEALSDAPPDALRTRTVRVRLEPGFLPPLVELTPNLVTAMVFTDSTGSPWPVTSSVLGSGSLYTSEILTGEPANRIIVAPLGNHGNSNLIVTFAKKDIPLVIRLKTASALNSERQVDSLIVFQLQERGPQALPETLEDDYPSVTDDILYSILDGLTPAGGRVLQPAPQLDGEIYTQLGEAIYLRTKHTLLWPAPRARVSGPGGLSVYEISPVSSILLSRQDGVVTIALEDAVVDPIGSWGVGR
ncbi:MAG: DotH/IcmK family type IV secretion protein, partial [Deltaproteobacteria bacterium]|nr:DotH/IcmK family type IV secretion protein [Deltaproteobacteria bacterium]